MLVSRRKISDFSKCLPSLQGRLLPFQTKSRLEFFQCGFQKVPWLVDGQKKNAISDVTDDHLLVLKAKLLWKANCLASSRLEYFCCRHQCSRRPHLSWRFVSQNREGARSPFGWGDDVSVICREALLRRSPQASLVEELSVEPFHVVNQSDRRFPVAFMEADKMISNCSMYQFFRSVNPSATTKYWY